MKTHHLIGYLDPGTSGVIVQMIGGGVAAMAVALKLYGRRILRVLHIGRKPDADTTSPVAPDDQTP